MKIKAVYNSKINKKICIGKYTFVNGLPIVVDVDEKEAAELREIGKQDWFSIIEEYPVANDSTKEADETVVEESTVEEAVAVEEAPVEEAPVEEAPKKKSRKSTKKNADSED